MAYGIIFDTPDILYKISEYLPFIDKIKFGICCNMNFLKFYDFTNPDYEDMDDLFQINFFTKNIKISSIDYKRILYQSIDINRRYYIKEYLEIFYPYRINYDSDESNNIKTIRIF